VCVCASKNAKLHRCLEFAVLQTRYAAFGTQKKSKSEGALGHNSFISSKQETEGTEGITLESRARPSQLWDRGRKQPQEKRVREPGNKPTGIRNLSSLFPQKEFV